MTSNPDDLKPVAVCEVCWLLDHTNWEPESVNESGEILMRLVGVDVPEKLNTDSVDVCCICGSITVAGIYDLKNSEDIIYSEDKNSEENPFDDPTAFILNMNDFENPMDEF